MPDTFVSSTHVITTPHWCLNPKFGNPNTNVYQAIEELKLNKYIQAKKQQTRAKKDFISFSTTWDTKLGLI